MSDEDYHSTPILIICYNRPEYLQKVLKQVLCIKPKRIYISQNFYESEEEYENWSKTRKIFIKEIPDFDIVIHERNEYLPVEKSIFWAIDWFFSLESEGIILEDDCIPDQSFFPFCSEMLKIYKDCAEVAMITGTNYFPDDRFEIYFFSKYFAIWGWATWRDRWMEFRNDTERLSDKKDRVLDAIHFKRTRLYYRFLIERIEKSLKSGWDYHWHMYGISKELLCLTPSSNLVSNIGIVGHGSLKKSKFHLMKTKSLPIHQLKKNKKNIELNLTYDRKIFKAVGKNFNLRFMLDEIILRIRKKL